MPIDTSIYANLKPVEMPSYGDSQQKAMSLSALAMQNVKGAKQLQQEDKDQQFADYQKKISVLGGAVDTLAGMPEQQRAQAYGNVRKQLLSSGAIGEQDAPEQYDGQWFSTAASQILPAYKKSKEYLDRSEQEARIAKIKNDSTREWSDARTAKNEKFVNDQITRYTDKTSDLSEVVQQMGMIQGLIDIDDDKQNVPGFGGTAWAPDLLVSQKGVDLRQYVGGLRNAVLKARSGGAVTPQEAERLLSEIGEGNIKNDRQLLVGLRNFRDKFKEMSLDREVAMNDAAKTEYQRRGRSLLSQRMNGKPLKENEKGGGLQFGSTAVAAPAPQMPDFDNMSVEDLVKYNGGGSR